MRSPRDRIYSAMNEYRAIKVAENSGGEGQEKWKETLILRFDAKNPDRPLFLVREGGQDSKFSNKQLNGETSFKGPGSKVDGVTLGEAQSWLEDRELDPERLERSLQAHELIQDLRN